MEILCQRFHAQPENSWNCFELEAEEIFYLSAGDQNGNAVGESNYDRPWNELHRRAHASESHDDENNPGHDGAHEQAIDTMNGDDTRDHDHEGSGRATDLSARSAERGDEKSRDDCAVNAGLRG